MTEERTITKIHKWIDNLLEYRSYFLLIAGLLMFYFANTLITTTLTSITNKYVVDCSHTAFAIGVCLFVLITTLYITYVFSRDRDILHTEQSLSQHSSSWYICIIDYSITILSSGVIHLISHGWICWSCRIAFCLLRNCHINLHSIKTTPHVHY